MRRRLLLSTLVLGTAVGSPAPAQVTLRTTTGELRDALADILYVWTSPVRADRRDWLVTAGVAAGFAALLPVDDQIDSWIVRHPNAVIIEMTEPFREQSKTKEIGDMSTGRRLFPISAVLIASGMVSDNRKLREAGWGCLSAWQSSSALRHVLYAGVGRSRPSVEGADQYDWNIPSDGWDEHSFFGGHVANAFACGTFWSDRFELGILEPLMYTWATGIALARMADRRHWASDEWVGIVVGYAMGRTISHRYKRREAERERARLGEPIRVAPTEGLHVTPTARGLVIGWRKSF